MRMKRLALTAADFVVRRTTFMRSQAREHGFARAALLMEGAGLIGSRRLRQVLKDFVVPLFMTRVRVFVLQADVLHGAEHIWANILHHDGLPSCKGLLVCEHSL